MYLPPLPSKPRALPNANAERQPVEAPSQRKVNAGAFRARLPATAEREDHKEGLQRRAAQVRRKAKAPPSAPQQQTVRVDAIPVIIVSPPEWAANRIFDRNRAVARIAPLVAPLQSEATARMQGPFLAPADRTQPRVALSPMFAKGGFSEIRFGRDQNGSESVWRSVQALQFDGNATHAIGHEQLRLEMLCLADIGSPLLPRQTHLVDDGRFFTEIPVYSASMDDVKSWVDQDSEPGLTTAASKMAVDTAIRVGKDIAKQLVVLHGRGWVHRDIKPDNIFYRPNGGAVLADFGLVASVNVDYPSEPIDGFAGTPNFMPPETDGTSGMGRTSHHASDIFSFGLTLADLASGGRIFEVRGLQAGEVFRYGTLMDLNYAPHQGPWSHAAKQSGSAEAAVAFIARTNPQLSALIFSDMMATDPSARPSARKLLARLNAMQPDGEMEDLSARATLDAASVLAQLEAAPGKQSKVQFQRLRTLI